MATMNPELIDQMLGITLHMHQRWDPACVWHNEPITRWQRWRFERKRGVECKVCTAFHRRVALIHKVEGWSTGTGLEMSNGPDAQRPGPFFMPAHKALPRRLPPPGSMDDY